MGTDNVDKRQVAHHEAGHAVVAYRLGLGIGSVTIKPDAEKGIVGASRSEEVWADGSKDADVVMVCYAGFAAERRVNPDADPATSGDDDAQAAHILAAGYSNATEPELRARTDALVEKHWAEVEAVAQALLERETLPDDEADLIMDAVVEGEDWRAVVAEYRRRFKSDEEG